MSVLIYLFFFNDTATTEIYTLSLHDALPICAAEDVIAVIRAGARGYVTKTISGPDLRDAVARVADGDVVFSPRLAGFVLDAFAATTPSAPQREDPATDPGLDLLSAREREVMQLLARGYTYREIGSRLFISV